MKTFGEAPWFFLYLEHYPCPFSFWEPSKSHIDTLALDAVAQKNVVSLQIAISVTQPASEDDQNEDGTTQGLSGVLKILHREKLFIC